MFLLPLVVKVALPHLSRLGRGSLLEPTLVPHEETTTAIPWCGQNPSAAGGKQQSPFLKPILEWVHRSQ